MLRSDRSLTSSTRLQVMPCGSMPTRVALLQVVVDHGGQQVVGGRHGVEVAGQVQVEVLERDDLAVAAAGRATLDPERRAHGGLADGDRGLLAEAGQGLPEPDGRRGLPLAERRRRDRRHDDVAGLRPVGQGRDGIEADLGHVGAVVLEQVRRNPHLRGDLLDRPQRRLAGDLYGWRQRHLTDPLRAGSESAPPCVRASCIMPRIGGPGHVGSQRFNRSLAMETRRTSTVSTPEADATRVNPVGIDLDGGATGELGGALGRCRGAKFEGTGTKTG